MAFDSSPSDEPEHEVPSLAECVKVQGLLWALAGVVTLGVIMMVFKPQVLSAMLWFWNQF